MKAQQSQTSETTVNALKRTWETPTLVRLELDQALSSSSPFVGSDITAYS